ncbi:MAG: hypothetical protein IPL53_11180 [Ignavibacteria bacterium]|nr:hypothetical protein [Ignavibacteria bacterium]
MDRKNINQYYSNEHEKDRLELEFFKLEGIRTKEIVSRYLSKDKMNIIDVGGGAGYYAFWLQEKGHSVSLIDLSPVNIELVNKHSLNTGSIDLLQHR